MLFRLGLDMIGKLHVCLQMGIVRPCIGTYKILFVLEYDVHLKLILLCDYVID